MAESSEPGAGATSDLGGAAPAPADPPGLHVAVIMDGNGRWATSRGRPRTAGHVAGVRSVRKVVEAAPELGIGVLTLYAFSSDNWSRPRTEVATLMRLFRRHLEREADELARSGVRLTVPGRKDRLPAGVLRAVERAERTTAGGTRMRLRVAVDYSARDALMRAARLAAAEARAGGPGAAAPDDVARLMGRALGEDVPTPDVDLLIRTGGERRLSDFLLWEAAYAELHFTPVPWPDFGRAELEAALRDYAGRERRFGRVPERAAG